MTSSRHFVSNVNISFLAFLLNQRNRTMRGQVEFSRKQSRSVVRKVGEGISKT